MKPQCYLNKKSNMTKKEGFVSQLSQSGEGGSSRQLRRSKRQSRTKNRVDSRQKTIEEERQRKRSKGVFLCDFKCQTTGQYCTHTFCTKNGLTRHNSKNNHSFPKGVSARDKIVLKSSKPGSVLTLGTLPDRQKRTMQQRSTIDTVEDRSYENEMAACLGKFHRKTISSVYKKPQKLIDVLSDLFKERPKLKATEMRKRMENMIDREDGGYMFCPSKALTNGILLPVDQIDQFIKRESQKKKI